MLDEKNTGTTSTEIIVGLFKELLDRLKADKTALEHKIKQVEINLAALGYKEIPTSRKSIRQPYGQNKVRVREFLEQHPTEQFKADAVADALNIHRSSALGTLKRLEVAGLAESNSDGLWTWKKKSNE